MNHREKFQNFTGKADVTRILARNRCRKKEINTFWRARAEGQRNVTVEALPYSISDVCVFIHNINYLR